MKIRMLKDKQAAPDGINILDLEKGKTYDLPEHMAKVFIDQKLAIAKGKIPKETKVAEPEETKVVEPPETKEKK